jgi:hypothetical protein
MKGTPYAIQPPRPSPPFHPPARVQLCHTGDMLHHDLCPNTGNVFGRIMKQAMQLNDEYIVRTEQDLTRIKQYIPQTLPGGNSIKLVCRDAACCVPTH